MMATKTVALTATAASMALAVLLTSEVTASAQTAPAVAAESAASESPIHRAHKLTPLTVRRRARPMAAEPAPIPSAVTPGTIIGAPLGVASTIVGLPFQAVGGIFGTSGPRSGGVTDVRYTGAGAETAKLDEGFVTPVPVDMSGPIYVVKNGDPTVNPLTFIGAPIAAAGSLAQLPFTVLGATAPKL